MATKIESLKAKAEIERETFLIKHNQKLIAKNVKYQVFKNKYQK